MESGDELLYELEIWDLFDCSDEDEEELAKLEEDVAEEEDEEQLDFSCSWICSSKLSSSSLDSPDPNGVY